MINRKTAVWIFAVLVVAQLAVPPYMAWRWEDVLRTGTAFSWETAPVDPHDALRGKYIDLNFKEMSGPVQGELVGGTMGYAAIGIGENGRAYISGVSSRPPSGPYLKAEVLYVDAEIDKAFVILPFKRYYLPEDMAQAAETAYRQYAKTSGVATVRIKDGYGVVEEVFINGKPLLEYLRAEPQ